MISEYKVESAQRGLITFQFWMIGLVLCRVGHHLFLDGILDMAFRMAMERWETGQGEYKAIVNSLI